MSDSSVAHAAQAIPLSITSSVSVDTDGAGDPPAGDAPQRQFVFIADGRLQNVPTVRHLLRFLDPVRTEDPCHNIMVRFLGDAALYALPVVDASGKPVALVDRKHYVEFFSKPYSREIFSRRNVRELLAHKDYKSHDPIIVDENRNVEDVAQIIVEAGIEHMVSGFLVCSQGRYLGVANGHDLLNIITQRKQAELHYLAHYDSLTGIPNRMLLGDRLDQACRDAERKARVVGLLFIDVDRFKQINDSLGHSVGDAVLRAIVERLKASARRADTVARLAGDEFVILMEDLADPADVGVVARRLVQSMQQPIELFGHSLVVTVSVGSALYPGDDTQISALLAKADAAMYEAKLHGRNGYRKYSSGTRMYNPASMVIENDLRRAIERDELVLHFQPQIELASKALLGVEALVRWRHPLRGLISPAQFIPIAEESGLIVPLGEWVLRQSLRQLKSWEECGLPPFRISVNISALQFQRRSFAMLLKALLAEYQVDPRLIELELTESALMQNFDEVLQTLSEIKSLGVSLAIDDFGTGFSSLSYLRRFPIDRLKIDQSFVRDIHSTPVNESIARAIVTLAKSLSLDVIAEGIEKPSERVALELMGCPEGQGYLFAKPLSAEDFIAWFNSRAAQPPVRAVPE
ncbi:MAG: EAL domain-containing protein [Burkholderiales bacterium]|jgi:diguanylate cyclase (GGDEF)-like protein